MPDVDRQNHGLKGNSHGYTYQALMLALCMLRSWKSKCNFSLETEKDGAGAFDDLVLKFDKGNGVKATTFVQIKHRNAENKKIKLTDLINKDSDACLTKFYDSYKTISQSMDCSKPSETKLVYCTNVDFHEGVTNESKGLMKRMQCNFFDLETFSINISSYKCINLPNAAFRDIKQSRKATDEDIRKFRESLVFAVHQPSIDELRKKIKEELKVFGTEIISEKIFDELDSFITKWMLRDSYAITFEVADKKFSEWEEKASKLSKIDDKGYRIIRMRRPANPITKEANRLINSTSNRKRQRSSADEPDENVQIKLRKWSHGEMRYNV